MKYIVSLTVAVSEKGEVSLFRPENYNISFSIDATSAWNAAEKLGEAIDKLVNSVDPYGNTSVDVEPECK